MRPPAATVCGARAHERPQRRRKGQTMMRPAAQSSCCCNGTISRSTLCPALIHHHRRRIFSVTPHVLLTLFFAIGHIPTSSPFICFVDAFHLKQIGPITSLSTAIAIGKPYATSPSSVRRTIAVHVARLHQSRPTHDSTLFSGPDDNDDGSNTNETDKYQRTAKRSWITKVQRILSTIYTNYLNWLDRKPMTANAVTAGIISAIGDILAQWIETTVTGVPLRRINLIRMTSFFFSGVIFVGPYLYLFYDALWKLGKRWNAKHNLSKRRMVCLQVLIDQTIGIVIFFPLYNYIYECVESLLALQGISTAVMSRATAKMRREIVSVVITNWMLWIPAQFITFAYVPERLRVIVVNIVSVIWNAYLCTRVA